MIINLFSIFDPSTKFILNNWISLFIPFFIYPLTFWSLNSRNKLIIKNLYNLISKEFNNNISINNKKSLILLVSLFFIIFNNNILGLFPYLFTPTRHLSITITLALPIWITLILYGWINSINHIFTHLLPVGTPIILSVFIVCIETIRSLIRPLTLSVRLATNIIAGHLLLSLLRNIREKTPLIIIPTYFILLALLILEFAVATIQSYVFSILISLYLREIN